MTREFGFVELCSCHKVRVALGGWGEEKGKGYAGEKPGF
jgi:hypothetical protein